MKLNRCTIARPPVQPPGAASSALSVLRAGWGGGRAASGMVAVAAWAVSSATTDPLVDLPEGKKGRPSKDHRRLDDERAEAPCSDGTPSLLLLLDSGGRVDYERDAGAQRP